MKAFRDQEYAQKDGVPLCFDLFHPGDGARPLVIMIHGGGWISGEREMYADEAEWFAQQGFAAATIDYRLAPLYPFPAAVADAQCFLAFVRKEAAKYGIDPNKIVAMGNSAGGHIAAMLGVSSEAYESDTVERVNAVIDICGLADMRNPGDSQNPISMSFIEQFLGGSYEGREQVYAQASPVTHVVEKRCPFLIVHGLDDDVVPPEQSKAIYDALTSQGGDAELVVLEGEGHSFTYEAWDTIRSSAVLFLKRVLNVS